MRSDMRNPKLHSRHHGFAFTEVLFAVAVLGIGFIMIAAIFPVAIQQSKTNSEETVGSTIARGGVGYLSKAAERTAFPATGGSTVGPVTVGRIYSFNDERIGNTTEREALWNSIRHNLILPQDPRYAFVPFYRRDGAPADNSTWSAHAQVILVPVEVRNGDQFTAADVLPDTGTPDYRTFAPELVHVKLYEGDINPDRLVFFDGDTNAANPVDVPAAAEGAYVIISEDRLGDDGSTTFIEAYGQAHGRIYRLARATGNTGEWELFPGNDMNLVYGADGNVGTNDDIHENIPARAANDLDDSGDPADAYLVSRRLQDPAVAPSATNLFEGPAMPVGVYTTFIRVP